MQINVATTFKLVQDKINLPTNRDIYEGSETAVGKLSARRIPPRLAFFDKPIIEGLVKHNSAENDDTKKAHLDWMRLLKSFPTVVPECP